MLRMLCAMVSVVESVVEYVVDQLLPSKTQFPTSLQSEDGVRWTYFGEAVCGICCIILRLLFAVALVMAVMLFAMASVVEYVVDQLLTSFQ